MPCIGHVMQEYPLQAYSIDSNTNFIETSYQKTFSSCTKPKLRSIVYYAMQMSGSALPATGGDLIMAYQSVNLTTETGICYHI